MQVVTVSGSIPEDFPEAYRNPKTIEIAKNVIRERLGLRPQDEVVIDIQGR